MGSYDYAGPSRKLDCPPALTEAGRTRRILVISYRLHVKDLRPEVTLHRVRMGRLSKEYCATDHSLEVTRLQVRHERHEETGFRACGNPVMIQEVGCERETEDSRESLP